MATEKTIFEYLDYRDFVSKQIQIRKRANPAVSLRSIAYKVGCNPGFFTRVLTGARNLSHTHMLKLGEVLKLGRREQRYFELLVQYNQARKQAEKEYYFEQLEVYREMNVRQVSNRQYAIYSHWYFMVLRELLHFAGIPGSQEDSAKVLSKIVDPPVSAAEVREALKILEAQRMIRRNSRGVYKLNEQFITSGADIPSVVVNRYLLEFMELARRAIDRHPRSERSLSTLTFSVSPRCLEKIKRKLDDYRQELMAIVNDDDIAEVDRVYHLNLQLFPVSKPYKGPKV